MSAVHPGGEAADSTTDAKGITLEEGKINADGAHDAHSEGHHGPLMVMKSTAKNPCGTLCCGCSFLFICLMMVGVLPMLNPDWVVMTFELRLPLTLKNEPVGIQGDMVKAGELQASFLTDLNSAGGNKIRELTGDHRLQILYVTEGGNGILDVGTLEKIKQFEDKILAVADYDQWCALDYAGDEQTAEEANCKRKSSILDFFDPEFFKPAFDEDATFTDAFTSKWNDKFAEISPVLDADGIATFTDYWSTYDDNPIVNPQDGLPLTNLVWLNADSNFGLTLGDGTRDARMKASRSTFYFGFPLRVDENGQVTEEELEEQYDEIKTFLYETYQDMFEDGIPGVTIYWDGQRNGMSSAYTSAKLTEDMIIAVLSFLFVLIYLIVQSGSPFLGCMGMGLILLNFGPALLLYRFIGGYTYFGVLHVVTVFIVLGIGVDDMFVFMDTWTAVNSEHQDANMHLRLSLALRHAGKAMATTSLSTIGSFLANTTSSFAAIYTFGTFCAFLMFCNFCTCCLVFPSVVATRDYYFKGSGWKACRRPKDTWGPTPPEGATLGKMEIWFRDKCVPSFLRLLFASLTPFITSFVPCFHCSLLYCMSSFLPP
jgi:hypothetical protein